MSNTKKRIISLTLIVVLIFTLISARTIVSAGSLTAADPLSAQTNSFPQVTIDGVPVEFRGQTPVTIDGHMLFPVRDVFESLGFRVVWNDEFQTVTLVRRDYTIRITIGWRIFTLNDRSASGSSRTYPLDSATRLINGSAMLPIRQPLESIGYSVDWDENTQTVMIITPEVSTAEMTIDNVLVAFLHPGDSWGSNNTSRKYHGALAMMAELGLQGNQIRNYWFVSPGEETDRAIMEAFVWGADMIFATFPGHEPQMFSAAQELPDMHFFQAAGNMATDDYGDRRLPNFHNYSGNIAQVRYLSGIAAGLRTETNILGFVAAHPNGEVISAMTAFFLGARSVNPDVRMYVEFMGYWRNPDLEAQIAHALIDRGADVITHHTDSLYAGRAAQFRGRYLGDVWAVGYNIQRDEAAHLRLLVSPIFDWSVYLTHAVRTVVEGGAIPADTLYGLNEGGVLLSDFNPYEKVPGTAEAIAAADEELREGRNIFTGPLYDNNGVRILASGEQWIEPRSAPSWTYIVEGITVVETARAPRVMVDDMPIRFDSVHNQNPAIIDGHVFVPVLGGLSEWRGVIGRLGFRSWWDEENRAAVLIRDRDDYRLVFPIGSYTFTVNDVTHDLDAPAQFINYTKMLPIRPLIEALGYEVDWDGDTQTVLITRPETAEEPHPELFFGIMSVTLMYLSFEDAAMMATDVVVAQYVETRTFGQHTTEIEFIVHDRIFGNAADRIFVYVDNRIDSVSMMGIPEHAFGAVNLREHYERDFTPGGHYVLFLQKIANVLAHTHEDGFMFLTNLMLDLNNPTDGKMYGYPLAYHSTGLDFDSGNLSREIVVEYLSYITQNNTPARGYIRSDRLEDIIDGSPHVLIVEIAAPRRLNNQAMPSDRSSNDIFYAIVEEVLKGDMEVGRLLRIIFFADTVLPGQRHIVSIAPSDPDSPDSYFHRLASRHSLHSMDQLDEIVALISGG